MDLIKNAMLIIKEYCESHPTCKGCDFKKKYIGCRFRGKSPREWKGGKYENEE